MRAWWIFFFPVFCCCSFCISFVIVFDDKIEAHCIYCVFLGGCSGSILLWWGRWKIAQICVHCMQTSSAITCIYPLSYVYYYIKAQKKNVRRSPEKTHYAISGLAWLCWACHALQANPKPTFLSPSLTYLGMCVVLYVHSSGGKL